MKSIGIHLIFFFIAMAMLESAVVIYLRELLYPHGFVFPLVGMKDIVILTELVRETATIVMLWTIAYVAGHNISSRFAWFMIGFGIWDIFYYVFLYIFIHWPASLLDWDILFLIPIPWYGPVIAPCIISMLMIVFGCLIIVSCHGDKKVSVPRLSILLLILGCLIVLWTFMGGFIMSMNTSENINLSQNILSHSQAYVPHNYSYILFSMGIVIIVVGIGIFYKRNN